MLPANARVRRRTEFATALRGSRARAGALVVHYGTSPISPGPRAGVIVSRAVGGAVVRNRLRRQLRHLLSALLPQLPTDAVIVVRALPGAAGRSSAQLASSLTAGLQRIVPSAPAR